MKKIVFVPVRMKDDYEKVHWPVSGNTSIEYPEPLYFGLNGVLAKTVLPEDELYVYPIITNSGDMAGRKNAKLFEDELRSLITTVKKIEITPIECEFDEGKSKFKELFKDLIKKLRQGAELTADITAGTKSLPLLIFSAMQFGEKFFDCSIGNVIYQKVVFKDNKKVPGSELLYDVTPLYLINSFTSTIESSSGETAIAAVEALFKD